jgi:pimeloyl-ACP methyl ester carboxylesterase
MGRVDRQFIALESPAGSRNGAGFHPCQGLYFTAAGEKPKTAFIATHYNVDFSEHYLGEYMAERGFGFLGWNTRFRGNEAFFLLEYALLDIGAGVRWLREVAGVENIVLLGNSGGGSLMAAYQSQAVDPVLEATPGLKVPDAVNYLLPGDYYVSLCAHAGRPEVLTDWMDPSVIDENDPASIDQSLNMYNPDNGPPYSADFITKYRAAQVARNNRITDWVYLELDRMKEHGMFDRAFNMFRTWADLRLMDGSIDPSMRPVGVCYAGDPEKSNFSPRGIGLNNTLRTWLNMWSLKSSPCRGAPHLAKINLPALVIQSLSDTGVFPGDAKNIYELLGSSDKKLELTEGDHYLTKPVDARDKHADMIAGWLQQKL